MDAGASRGGSSLGPSRLHDGSHLLPKKGGSWHASLWSFRVAIFVTVAYLKVGSYFAFDSTKVLADELEEKFGSGTVSDLNLIYHYPGMIGSLVAAFCVDTVKTRTSTVFFALLVFIGVVITAYGQQEGSSSNLLIGRVIFGVGGEALGVVQLLVLTRWFSGNELGLAIGASIAVQRLGSVGVAWGLPSYEQQYSLTSALWFVAGVVGSSLVAAIIFFILERKAQAQLVLNSSPPRKGRNLCEGTTLWIIESLSNLGIINLFLQISIFYAMIISFADQAPVLIARKTPATTEEIAELYTYGMFAVSVVIAPLCGHILDRIGHRASILVAATALFTAGMLLLALAALPPLLALALMGTAYGMYATVVWTAIALLAKEGSAGLLFGLCTAVQNAVIVTVHFLDNQAGTARIQLLRYAATGASTVVLSVLLLLWDARRNEHRLEMIATPALQVFDNDDDQFAAAVFAGLDSNFSPSKRRSIETVQGE